MTTGSESGGMASSGGSRPNFGRRFFWLAFAIVLAGGLYTAGWFYAADLLVKEVDMQVAALNRDGRRASCENAEARGYPFRLGVFCHSVMFEDARAGIGFRARQFRSAAQVYAPYRVIGELDGPATLQVPGLNALDLDWEDLRSSARLASPMPERLSVAATGLSVRLDEPGDMSPLLGTAGIFELHMRPAGAADIDLAVRFADLRLEAELTGVEGLAPLDGMADFTLSDGARLLRSREGLRGRSGTIRSAVISLSGREAGVSLSGPVSVGEDGLVNAQLQVTVRDADELAGVLAEIMPDARREIELALSGLAAMGETPTLPLRIVDGEALLGFLSLGSIPPL